MLDLDRIDAVCKELDDRLGPQEWTVEGPDWRGLHSVYDGDGNRWFTGVEEKARFVARARTWLPALAAELREARDELAAVNEAVSKFYAPSLEYMQPEIERLRALVPSPDLLRCLADYECAGRHTIAQQALALARRIEEAKTND